MGGNMKGQTTLMALIFTAILIVLYGAMLPVINTAITAFLPSADAPTSALLQLTPAIILILVLMGLFVRRQ